MQLFYAKPCPFARKARVLLRERGLQDRLEEVPVAPHDSPADLLAVNPASKVPALRLDDGAVIIESNLIAAHLDSLGSHPALIPSAQHTAQLQCWGRARLISPRKMKQERQAFHAGERGLQTLAGVEQTMQRRGAAVIRDFMPEQHRQFFAGLSYVFAATLDPQGNPQANLLTGSAGFIKSPDPRRLMIHHPEAAVAPGTFAPGEPVALLGIDLANARRNRANGVFESDAGDDWKIRVEQSFGNCPQYIHRRSKQLVPLPPVAIQARELIASAATFFIASRSTDFDPAQGGGLDISHRGGTPGFVRWLDAHTLMFPDYPGNKFFNTLGNLSADARTSLLFIDFQSGQTVGVRGQAEIAWGASASPAGPAAPDTLEVRIKVEAITPGRIAPGFQWSLSAIASQFAAATASSDLNRA